LDNRGWDIDPSCIDILVNAAEELNGALDGGQNVAFVGQISWEDHTAPTTGTKFCEDLLEVMSTACEQDDICPGLGERKSCSAPQPTTGSSHQSHLSVKCQGSAGHEPPPSGETIALTLLLAKEKQAGHTSQRERQTQEACSSFFKLRSSAVPHSLFKNGCPT
jgi:hypothetical protein